MHLPSCVGAAAGVRSGTSPAARLGAVVLAAAAVAGLVGCSDDAADGDVEGFCAKADPPTVDESFYARVEYALENGPTDPTTGDTVEQWVLDLGQEASARLVADAPGEIRADVEIVLDAQWEALEEGEVPDLDEVRRAAERVDAWTHEHCR